MKIVYTEKVSRCIVDIDTETIYINYRWLKKTARKYGVSHNHMILHEVGHCIYDTKSLDSRWKNIYTRYQDVIEYVLKEHGIPYAQLDEEEIFSEIYALHKTNLLGIYLDKFVDSSKSMKFFEEFIKLIS